MEIRNLKVDKLTRNGSEALMLVLSLPVKPHHVMYSSQCFASNAVCIFSIGKNGELYLDDTDFTGKQIEMRINLKINE